MFRLGRSTDLSPADIDMILMTWIMRKRIKKCLINHEILLSSYYPPVNLYLSSNISSSSSSFVVVILYRGAGPLRNKREDGLCHGGHQTRVLILQHPGPREHRGRLPGPASPHQMDLPLTVLLLNTVEE